MQPNSAIIKNLFGLFIYTEVCTKNRQTAIKMVILRTKNPRNLQYRGSGSDRSDFTA